MMIFVMYIIVDCIVYGDVMCVWGNWQELVLWQNECDDFIQGDVSFVVQLFVGWVKGDEVVQIVIVQQGGFWILVVVVIVVFVIMR